eukprot:Nitzschia sp. Nitz4//scaffold111_size72815//40013//40498//NITZ4_005790-RA/size72815-processed-gene-0.12-mRNA-1//1//CDS//3329533180//483//frame0
MNQVQLLPNTTSSPNLMDTLPIFPSKGVSKSSITGTVAHGDKELEVFGFYWPRRLEDGVAVSKKKTSKKPVKASRKRISYKADTVAYLDSSVISPLLDLLQVPVHDVENVRLTTSPITGKPIAKHGSLPASRSLLLPSKILQKKLPKTKSGHEIKPVVRSS